MDENCIAGILRTVPPFFFHFTGKFRHLKILFLPPSLLLLLPPSPLLSHSYHLMQSCWKRYSSDRPHFEQILNILTTFMDRLKRPDSVYYSESESEDEVESNNVAQRQGSGKVPSRTPSLREGEAETGSQNTSI